MKDSDINEVMQKQDLMMEYSGNGQLDKSLKREYSKAKLITPRSEKAFDAFLDAAEAEDSSVTGED